VERGGDLRLQKLFLGRRITISLGRGVGRIRRRGGFTKRHTIGIFPNIILGSWVVEAAIKIWEGNISGK
jgi:hypothetical protein